MDDPFGGLFSYVPGMEPSAPAAPPPEQKKKPGVIPEMHKGPVTPAPAPAQAADPFGGLFDYVPGMEPAPAPAPKPELPKFVGVGQSLKDAVVGIGSAATDVLPESMARAVRKTGPSDDPNSKLDAFIAEQRQDQMDKQLSEEERAQRTVFGFTRGGVREGLAQFGNSIPSMILGLAGRYAGGVVGGALGLGTGPGAIATAAAGAVAGGMVGNIPMYRMKYDQVMDDYLTEARKANPGLTKDQLIAMKPDITDAAHAQAMNEVVPEMVTGGISMGLASGVAGKVAARVGLPKILMAAIRGQVMDTAMEVAGETVTEKLDSRVAAKYGLSDQPEITWGEALQQVWEPTVVMSLASFGLASAGSAVQNRVSYATNKQAALENMAQSGIPEDIRRDFAAAKDWKEWESTWERRGQDVVSHIMGDLKANTLSPADELAAFNQREQEQAKGFVARMQKQVADMRARLKNEPNQEGQEAIIAQIEDIEKQLDNVIKAYPGAHNPADVLKPGQNETGSAADQANIREIEEATARMTGAAPPATGIQQPVPGGLPIQQQPGTVPAATAPANPDAMPAQKQAMVGNQGPFDILGVPNNPGKITLWDPATGQSFVEDRANVTMVDPPAPGASAALPVAVMGPDGTRHEVAFPDNAAARMYEAAARFEERKMKPASVDPVLDRMAKELGVTKPVLLQQAAAYKAAVDAAMMAAGPGAAVQAPAFGATSNVQQPTSNIQGGANAQQALQTETPVGGQVPIIGKPADEKFQSLETTQIPGSTTQIPAARSGQRFEAVTPQGDVRVSGEWAVMDAGALITSDDKRYDAALQPRDRDTKSSQEQIAKIAAAPDPTRLNDSPTTDLGAPMVDELGQVISGNGRVMGLRKAFASKRGAAYQDFVKQRAAELGVDVSGMKNPVLVRMVRDTAGVPMPQVAELSNRPQILQRTSAEIAAADSKVLAETNIMNLFDPSDSGDMMAASNRPFLTEFVRQTGDESLRKSDGTFDREKIEPRIHRAVMMRIIGQTEKGRDLARQAIENAEVLGIRPALVGVMRAGGKLVGTAKVKPQYELSAELAEGLELLVQFKKEFTEGKTRTLDGWLAQQDMFKAPASLEGTIILQELARRRSIKSVTEFLNEYAERAAKVDTDTGMMFADIQPSTKLELLRGARDATMPTAEDAAADAGGVAREERAEYGTRPDYKGIATKAHEGQTRKDGITPYITHPERVVARLAGDPDAQAVAWLHDVVEDTSETIESLRGRGVPENILEAVDALTKRPGIDYAEYIQRIKSNTLARKVKIADMMDNLSGSPGPEARARYIKGLKTLQAGAPYNAASGKPQMFRSEDKPVYGSAPAESSRDSVWAALKKKMPWFTNAIDGYLSTRHPYLQDELIRVAAIEPQKLDLTPEQEANIKKAKELAKVKLDEDVKTHQTAFDAYQAEFTPEIVEGYVRQVEEVALLFGDGAFALARGVPLKSARRGIEKAVEDSTIEGISVDAAIAKIKDIVRSTILVHNESDLAAVAEAVKESFGVTKDLGKHKDRTGDNHTLGYEDHLIQVPLSNGRFAEVQVMTPVMFVAKEFGAGHKYYEMDREVRAAHTAGFMSRNQQDKFRNKLAKLSKEFYQSLAKKPYVLAFERVAREASSDAISSLDMRASSPVWPKGQPDLRETGVGSTVPSDLESRNTSERSSTSNVSLRSKKIAEGEKDSTSEAAGDSSSAFISGIPSTDNVVQRQQEIKQKLAENARNLPKKQRGYFWEYAAHKARIEAGEPAGKPPRPRLAGGVPMTGAMARRIRAQVDALVEESRQAMPERAGVAREERATYGTRQTETPEFKAWFRDSRVVDEKTGEPLRVFHGTISDFDTFRRPGDGARPRPRTAGRQLLGDREMHFFTSDPDVASNYANTEKNATTGKDEFMSWGPHVQSNVMPVYLSIQNPLRMTAEGQGWPATVDRIKHAYDSGNYDGAIVYDVADWYSANERMAVDPEGNRRTATVYIAFKANQIKSATGNSGAFSRKDRSVIREEDRAAYGIRQDQPAPPFFSQLRRHIEAKMPKRAPVEAVRNLINPEKGSGVKAEEVEWTGLGDFLSGKSPVAMVTKEDVLAAIQDVNVEEVTLGEGQKSVEENFRSYSDDELRNYIIYNLAAEEDTAREMNRSQMLDYVRQELDVDGVEAEASKQTRYDKWQLPGGENYRELLLTLPVKSSGNGSSIVFPSEDALESFLSDMDMEGLSDLDYGRRDEPNTRVVEFDGVIPASAMRIVDANNGSVVSGNEADGQTFVATHFSQPNILAHVRFNERTDAEGRRVLFIEEVQSDWHQKGREKGYRGVLPPGVRAHRRKDGSWTIVENEHPSGGAVYADWASGETEQKAIDEYTSRAVPDAPFKNNAWARLAMKRMIRWAAENGFDSVAWTTGEQQAERYDLSKQVDSVWARKSDQGLWNIQIMPKGRNKDWVTAGTHDANKLPGVVGKELAEKIINEQDTTGRFKGQMFHGVDLKVGGDGMKGFYDKILVNIANELGKKFGARAEMLEIPSSMREYRMTDENGELYTERRPEQHVLAHVLPITPAMRDSVVYQGQALFERKPAGGYGSGQMSLFTPEVVAAARRDVDGGGPGWTNLMRGGSVPVGLEVRDRWSKEQLGPVLSVDRDTVGTPRIMTRKGTYALENLETTGRIINQEGTNEQVATAGTGREAAKRSGSELPGVSRSGNAEGRGPAAAGDAQVGERGGPVRRNPKLEQVGFDFESTTGKGVSGPGVSTETRTLAGQSAPGGAGLDLFAWSRTHAMVPETPRRDAATAGTGTPLVPTRNYDLRGKPSVRLSKSERKRINAQVVNILDRLDAENRPATDAERDILRQYTGEGGLSSGTREALTQHWTDYETTGAMWETLERAGVPVVRALEGAGGAGNFVGQRPGLQWTTVDIDATNHRVLKALYPDAKHYLTSFEYFKDDGFDVAISNVPFLEMRSAAGIMKIRRDIKSLHDFYFAHSLDRVKPNGVIAYITSTGTMDKKDASVRREVIGKADVLAAYRLPEGHFSKNAHTEVTTDIIYLMRRPDGVAPSAAQQAINEAWAEAAETADGVTMSRYYEMFPQNILGEKTLGKDWLHGGKPMYVVKGPADLSRMSIVYKPYATATVTGTAKKAGASSMPKLVSAPPTRLDDLAAWAKKNGFMVRNRARVVTNLGDGKQSVTEMIDDNYSQNVFVSPDGKTVWRASDLVDLKDVEGTAKVYRPITTVSADKIAMLDRITKLAEAFQNEGDSAAATSAIELIAEYREKFNEHPKQDKGLKAILEKAEPSMWAEFITLFDDKFAPADVFTQQTRYSDSGKAKVAPDAPLRVRAFASENNKGIVKLGANNLVKASEWAAMAGEGYALVGVDDASANEPFTMQNAILYYSGNMYEKLEKAESLRRRATDPVQRDILDAQIAKLESLKPLPKSLPEMTFRGTEAWIRPILDKARLFRLGQTTDEKSGQRRWTHPNDAVENYLNNRQLVKRAVDKEGNPTETEGQFMARTREAEEEVRKFYMELKEEIASNPELLQEVEHAYNSRFRNYVAPNYADARYLIGDLIDEMQKNHPKGKIFRKNQVEWAIQGLYEGKGINAHDVGGGKTDAAILLAAAMKRRGMAQKPMLVVPAKIIHKWERAIKGYLPNAKIVNLGKLDAKTRTEKLFNLANTNADFVLISHEGFENIELPVADELRYLDELLLENIDDPDYKGRDKGKLEERMASLRKIVEQRERDGRLTMDKLGVDMVVVDEGHNYKNIGIRNELVRFKLGTAFGVNTGERDVKGPDGKPVVIGKTKDGKPIYKKEETASLKSARSYDLRFKARFITEWNNGNNVFLLTATPTPNKPMEVFTMLKHLDTHIFDEYGIQTDKDFSNQFFDMGMVMNPTAGEAESILRGIVNAQELRGILNRFVDKRTTEQLGITGVPEENVERHWLEQSDGYALVADDLRQREKNMPSPFERQPGDDTIIAVYTGGRAASVDPRLYGGDHAGVTVSARTYDAETDKIQAILDLVTQKHAERPEAKQLIFLDAAGHQQVERGQLPENLHAEMKKSLVDSGAFRPEQIAIINGKVVTDSKTGVESSSGDRDLKKQAIVDAYTDGKILVVIGTTTSMGEGMGLQKGTTDIYHADFPYTPGAIRQRNGRGVRYGNREAVVNTHLFFMKGTFDGLSYGIIANKKGWNEAIWDKEVADYISTAEEMMGNAIPPRETILIEMETDPLKKAQLIAGFEANRVHQARAQAGEIVSALHGRRAVAQQNIAKFRQELAEREAKLRDLVPNEKVKDEEKRAEAFKTSKENLERLIDVSKRKIQENNQLLGNIAAQIQIQDAEYAAATRRLEAFSASFVDQLGNVRVKVEDVESVIKAYESGLALGQSDPSAPVAREDIEKYLTARDVTDPAAPDRLEADLRAVREASTEPYQMDLFAGVPNDADMTPAQVDELADSLNAEIEEAFTNPTSGNAWKRVFTEHPVEASTIIPELVKGVHPGEYVAARGIKINTPADFAAILMPLRNPLQESMKVAYLDASNRIIELRVVTVGIVDSVLVDPRVMLGNPPKGTRRMVIAHNHPSGNPQPSREDIKVTRQVIEAARLVGIPILDHVITNGGTYQSLRESGLVSFNEQEYGRMGGGKGQTPPKTLDEQAVADWELVPRKNLLEIRDPGTLDGIIKAMRQADPDSGHAIFLTTKHAMTAVVRFPKSATVEQIQAIVARAAMRNGASAMLIDLPSNLNGDAMKMARAMYQTAQTINVELLDVATLDNKSLRESGLLKFQEERSGYGRTAVREEAFHLRDGSNVKPPPVKSRDFATYDILPDGTKRLIPLSERFDRNYPSIFREDRPGYGSAKPSKTVQEMERELEALRQELKHLSQRIPKEAAKANEGMARLLAAKQKLIDQLLAQRANVAESQRLLAAYMREQKIPDSEQKRMISAIIRLAKLKTPAGLERHYRAAIEHIDGKAKFYAARESINKVRELLKASFPKIVNMYPRGKLTADAHKELKKIAVITNFDERRIDKELDRLGDEIDAFSDPDRTSEPARPLADVLHEQFLVMTFGNLNGQNPEQAKKAVESLEKFIELGMFEHQAKEKARQERIAKLRETAVDIISGGKGAMDKVDRLRKNLNRGVARRVVDAIDAYDTGHQSFEWLLDKLSRFEGQSGVLKSELQYWADLAHRATHDEVSGRRDAWGQVQTKLQEIYGLKGYRLAHVLSENSKVVAKTGVILAGGKEAPMSRNQAYKLWQVFQDPSQYDRLLNPRNGYTADTPAQLEAFMGTKLTEYAKWQLDEFYPKYYEGVNRVYRELYFIDLPFNNRYSPITAEFENAFEDDKLLENPKRQSSVLNGSLKMRKPNANSEIRLVDGDSLLVRHIVQMEHFKHWGLVMRDMRGVFNNSDVSRAVRDYHGDFAARTLKGFINDFARGGEDQALVLGSLDKMRSYFTRAVVASGVTTLKQLTSIPAAMSDLGPGEFMAGFASFMTNPVGKSKEMFAASKMLQNRYEAGFDRDVMLALRRSEPTRLSGAASIGEIFSWFTRGGDIAAVLAAGYTMYRSTMNKALAAGKSADVAKAEAVVAMEKAVERVQQAGNVKDLGAFQRLGSFAKLFTMFMTAPIAYYRVWSGGWRNLVHGRGSKAENVRRIALTHIVLPVFFQYVADAFMWGNPDDDDEDDRLIPWLPKTQTRALLLGPMNGLFIAGNGLNHIIAAFQKEKTFGDFASVILPPADIGNDITKAARRIGRSIINGEITEKDLRSLLEDIAEAGGKMTGLPTGPAMRMGTGIYEGATDQTEFPIRRALGYSRFMLGEDPLNNDIGSGAVTGNNLRPRRPTLRGFTERPTLGRQ